MWKEIEFLLGLDLKVTDGTRFPDMDRLICSKSAAVALANQPGWSGYLAQDYSGAVELTYGQAMRAMRTNFDFIQIPNPAN